MKCMATVLMGVLVFLILAPAVIRAATMTAPPLRHTNVAYAGSYGAMEPSTSASRLPLPAGTSDLITIAVYAVLGAVLLGLILITAFVVAILRRQPITRSRQVRGQMEVEETRIMQEIYRSLAKMENGIESLETLLLERPAAREFSGSFDRGVRRP